MRERKETMILEARRKLIEKKRLAAAQAKVAAEGSA